MIRFLLRCMPRFGFLTLFSAMLLFVSAAGWWKFHLDLYLEERDAVAALKASGGHVSIHRDDPPILSMRISQEDEGVPLNAPFYAPIQQIVLGHEPSDAARDAALRLPRLKAYVESPASPLMPTPLTPSGTATSQSILRPPGTWNVETLLGRPLPTLETSEFEIDALDEPLPEGDPVEPAEADQIAAAIFAAWRNPAATPPRRLAVHRSIEENVPAMPRINVLRVDLFDPDRHFRYTADGSYSGDASTFADGRRLSYDRKGFVWRRRARRIYSEDQHRLTRRFPADDYPFYAPDFWGDDVVHQAVRTEESVRFQRVAKVDDVRYRVDFAPFEAPLNEYEVLNDHPPRVTEWSCVVRADFNWAPESSNLVQQKAQGGRPTQTLERRMLQRFRRDGDYVSLAERLHREKAGTTVREVRRTVYGLELDPEYEERVFDPLSLDQKGWPEPRPLPAWRWYRATFALACVLTAFLLGSRVVGSLRRKRAADSADTMAEP